MNNTKERPIILTAQEVNAVLAGDKTQHRVIIENTKDTQCLFNGDWRYDGRDFLDSDGDTPDPEGAHYVERLEPEQGEENQYTEDYRCVGRCPLGSIGDRLWVRETHHVPDFLHDYEQKELAEGLITRDDLGMSYKADAPHMTPADGGWTSPVAMPRWASRLLLEITDIRIERVRDITHNDSVAEYCFNFGEKKKQCIPPLSGFAEYWREKHGDDSWRSNPWVWVIEFKVVEPSEVQGG